MVSAGALDQLIRVERANRAPDAYGEPVIGSWSLVGEPWAQVITATGREIVAGERDTETNTIAFRVRDGLDVRTSDRIVWNGQAHNVIAINPAPRRGELVIEARQVDGASGA